MRDLPNTDPSLLNAAAAAAAGHQQHPAGALYVVATPIGNLADLSLRAIHVLGLVDAIACEDTRVTSRLLSHLGIVKPLVALHAHNEAEASLGLVGRLAAGARIAVATDAGTPGVSDPGARLAAAATAAGIRVVPIPGASSVLAAIAAAGDVGVGGFVFVGFLPARGGDRRAALAAATADPRTQVVFEAPHRVEAFAAELAASCPQRRITIARELTKQFEHIETMAAAHAPSWLADDADRRRGEFVVVLHAVPVPPRGAIDAEAERCLRVLSAALPLRQAVALASEITAAPRNALYELALSWRDGAAGRDDG